MLQQVQSQRQQMRIFPQQIQLLNLFYLNSLELQQRIKNELEENPFIDAHEEKIDEEYDTKPSKENTQDFESPEENMYDDRSDYKLDNQYYFNSETPIHAPIVNKTTFREDAKQQLQLLNINENDKEIAEYIIDILNSNGFMDKQPDEIADSISFYFERIIEVETIQRALAIVQSLDPVGIGVYNIRECLLLQLHNMSSKGPSVQCAILLLKDHYNDLMRCQFKELSRKLKIADAEMKAALNLIGRLKFHPVNEIHQYDSKQTIIPDFIITNSEDNIQVSLYSSKADSIFVNQSLYNQLSNQINHKDKAAYQYVKNKLTGAQWFVNAIKDRENNMLRIMQCIVTLQCEYFIHGDIKYLKPMVLRNISEKLGLDVATISRITGNKYADTPFGLIYLKKLFSEGIADKSGEIVSNKVIQSVIMDTIESETKNNPLTDLELVNLLSLKGYNIARRTVTKYRQQMQVPISQIRAVWA